MQKFLKTSKSCFSKTEARASYFDLKLLWEHGEVTLLLKDPQENISGKSNDLECRCSGEEVNNVGRHLKFTISQTNDNTSEKP